MVEQQPDRARVWTDTDVYERAGNSRDQDRSAALY